MNFDRFDIKFAELHSAMQKQIKEAVDPEAAMEDMNTKINVIMDALGLEIPESTAKEETEEVEEVIEEPVEEETTEEETTEQTEEKSNDSDTFVVPEGLENQVKERKFEVTIRPRAWEEIVVNNNFDGYDFKLDEKVHFYFDNYDALVDFLTTIIGVNEHDLDTMKYNFNNNNQFLFGNIKAAVYKLSQDNNEVIDDGNNLKEVTTGFTY